MENALDAGGYEGKYIVQTYGTSELGGKLLAEGTNIEAVSYKHLFKKRYGFRQLCRLYSERSNGRN